MSPDEPVKKRKLPLFQLCIVAFVIVAAALLLLRGVNLRGLATQGMAVIRDAGPWVYFAATAFLPAVGAPLSAFTIVAGPSPRR